MLLQSMLECSRTDGDQKYHSLLTSYKRFSNLRELITTAVQDLNSIQGDTRDITKQLHYLISLTYQCRLFTDLLRKVGTFGQAVQVSLQDIPANLIVEGETKLGMNLKNRDKKHVFICTLAIQLLLALLVNPPFNTMWLKTTVLLISVVRFLRAKT